MPHLVHKLSDDLKARIRELCWEHQQGGKSYPHGPVEAGQLIERAMFESEVEKSYPDRQKTIWMLDQPPSKTLRELITLKEKTERFGFSTDQIDNAIRHTEKRVAPAPGRQANVSVKPRADGGVSRLAKAVFNALTGCGIPCTGNSEGYKIIESIVGVVYGDVGVKKLSDTDILRTR